jgi:hypothetical protein
MTRFIHDQFAKDYLEELLKIVGEVKTSLVVRGEVREIDVWFEPFVQQLAPSQSLGILGKIATTSCLIEPFRNAVEPQQICDCLLKSLELRGEIIRQNHGEKKAILEKKFPQLWILTPTASENLLQGFHAQLDEVNWGQGIYFCPKYYRMAIVAIHQLPQTIDTLWLRILGKGRVQKQAIDDLQLLSTEEPQRSKILELLFNLTLNLESTTGIGKEDRELIMRLSPLYLEKLSAAIESATQQAKQEGLQEGRQEGLQEGRQEGLQEGRQEGERIIVENLLKARFGSLDRELLAIVEPLLKLSPEDFTPLLLQLNRQELLNRFG